MVGIVKLIHNYMSNNATSAANGNQAQPSFSQPNYVFITMLNFNILNHDRKNFGIIFNKNQIHIFRAVVVEWSRALIS